ncbi:CO/xanthine dehydrogenase Mo-binding subunit [Streptomyces sp. B1I3]|nr:CO/xanthine dehydrogenase Mo-binding subunit [Streptomyces sp. B1I3]
MPGQMLNNTPNVSQVYRTVPLDVNTPLHMRGPGFATASFVIESAMDELAAELGIDPIELRRRNEPSEDESKNLPYFTRRLRECYTTGARQFGWDQRRAEPRSRREGDWLIGMGMAVGVYDPPSWAWGWQRAPSRRTRAPKGVPRPRRPPHPHRSPPPPRSRRVRRSGSGSAVGRWTRPCGTTPQSGHCLSSFR